MSEIRVRRHRIRIEKKVAYPFGGIWAWVKVCATWAEIHADKVTIRYQPNLLPGMHVVIGAERYEITGVIDHLGKTRLVELQVKSLADETMPSAIEG